MNNKNESPQEYSVGELYEIGKQRSKSSLIDFSIHTDKKYDPSWHHELIALYLEKIASGEIDRLLITLPPRHGKSQLATINFPAWYVGNNPSKSIITASYSGDLATEFGRKVRNLVASPIYKEVFDVNLAEDSKSAGTWHTKDGGCYVAAGVGGAITGKGANVFIIDDPIKGREDAESEIMREKVWDWYSSVAYTRLEENSAMVLIQTRWHDDDLAGRLIREGKDEWVHLNFPAIATEDEEYRKKGDPLWEKKYPLKELERRKKNMIPYDWAALFQQDPINREDQEFKAEWFQYYDEEPYNLNIYITVDPAISKKDDACNSVVMVCGIDPEYNWYILEYTAKKLNPSELIDEIYRLSKKWRPITVGIETVAFQQAIKHFSELKMDEEEFYLNIEEIRSRSDKRGRIRGLIPYYSKKKVYHRRFHTELENELLKFPSGKLVDIIDALSMQIPLIDAPAELPEKPPRIPYANKKDKAPWMIKKEVAGYVKLYSHKR